MTRRRIDWPWALTMLCLASLLGHYLVIIAAALLFPDWSLMAASVAIGLICVAVVLFVAVIGHDYWVGWGRAGRHAPD